MHGRSFGDFDPRVLMPAEELVLAKVGNGEVARLLESDPTVLRAEFLRHLLLACRFQSAASPGPSD
jgi:hypothetical protein